MKLAAGWYRIDAVQRRALVELGPELQLFHHQADEVRSARRTGQRHLADPLCVSGALGEDRPRRQLISLDDKGAAYFANENAGPNATRGVRILFAGSDGQERTLYYFLHRSFEQRREERGLPEILRALAPGNSLIKSASYLLQSGNFTTVRYFLLANSATIIQDDSGISSLAAMIRRNGGSFRSAAMTVRLPSSPEGTSRNMLSCSRRSQSMDFGIGYRWRSHESNLLAGGGSCPLTIQSALPPPHRLNRRI